MQKISLVIIIILIGITLPFFSLSKQRVKTNCFKVEGVGMVKVINLGKKTFDKAKLTSAVKEIINAADEGKLEIVRTKIFEDHEIVKDAKKNLSVVIDRKPENGKLYIMIPVKYKLERIILFKKDNISSRYELFSWPDDLKKPDVGGCFK